MQYIMRIQLIHQLHITSDSKSCNGSLFPVYPLLFLTRFSWSRPQRFMFGFLKKKQSIYSTTIASFTRVNSD
ncbi:hypothetical protein PanWU01x14_213290 [Parasponia andersonii]|uniref:Uncharacterized protein n=1 Tax=Parasponia andersonii TaxID=3476 RepID=A0A2P5BSZ3_PARAD|nr:hypothetical protein PanWU01x14_213290 [Parasponia andersonii]